MFKTISAAAALNPAPRLVLDNEFVNIVYRPDDKQITVCDKKDQNNLPACYSKNKRGIAKCWTAMCAHFDRLTGMEFRDAQHVMTEHNIRYHYWCRMD